MRKVICQTNVLTFNYIFQLVIIMLTISNRQHIAMKQVFEQVANCAKFVLSVSFFFLLSPGTLE